MAVSKDGQTLTIVSGARTPMAEYSGTKGYGRLKDVTAIDLAAAAGKAALERGRVDPKDVDQAVFGNATQSSSDALYGARHVALKAGVPETAPALTVNRICGSGLQAVVSGAEQILLGRARTTLCGGMENMSQVPFVIRGAREGFRLGQDMKGEDLLFAALLDPYCGFFMAQTAENVAKDHGISRAAQDEYALRSHQLGAAAVKAGKFAEEIVPVQIKRGDKVIDTVTTDDHIKPDTTLEGLAALRPAFGKDGTVTAGNAPSVNDGAAALVIMSEGRAKEMGLKPLARVLDSFSSGVDPAWVMLTPVPAVRGLLGRNPDWKLEDFDVIELNEAFSVQALAVQQELGLDPKKVNPNGGSVALGHPIGASGARIVVTLLHELTRRGGGKGLATLCLGGGNGVAVAFEALG